MQSTFQSIPKVISGVQVRALCMTLNVFCTDIGKLCLYKSRFVHRDIVILEQVWTKPAMKASVNATTC